MTQSGFNPPKQFEPLQAVAQEQTWKGASPSNPGMGSTSRIMIKLIRDKYKVPTSVPDGNPSLKQMAILEYEAAQLRRLQSTQLDQTLATINKNIEQIGSAGTRPAAQMQNQFYQRAAEIKVTFQAIVKKQDDFADDVKKTLQLKDEKFNEISKGLSDNKVPDKTLLTGVIAKFQELANKSKELDKEESRINDELKRLDKETKQSAIAITGEEATPRLSGGPE